jgi:hypothetical protein
MSDTVPVPKIKVPTCHLSNGDKGNVGKTMFAKAMLEMYDEAKKPRTVVDMDISTPNVARVYAKNIVDAWRGSKPAQMQQFSEADFFARAAAVMEVEPKKDAQNKENTAEKSKQQVINDLLSLEQITLTEDPDRVYLGDRLLEIITTDPLIDTICSLPANVYGGVRFWLDENDIDQQIAKGKLSFRLVNWWLTDGGDESMSLLADFIDTYPNIKHVLVLNKGIKPAMLKWGNFLPSERLTKYFQEGKLKCISLPPLFIDLQLITKIQQDHTSYTELTKIASPFAKVKIDRWLEGSSSAIQSTGLCFT